MAYIKYSTSKKGVLVARIQVYGKDPATGQPKLYPKNIRNEEGLTEAKFKKKINKIAIELEERIAAEYKDQMTYIHTGVLTFSQLAEEWIAGINAHQSHNYYLRATDVCNLFNGLRSLIPTLRKSLTNIILHLIFIEHQYIHTL